METIQSNAVGLGPQLDFGSKTSATTAAAALMPTNFTPTHQCAVDTTSSCASNTTNNQHNNNLAYLAPASCQKDWRETGGQVIPIVMPASAYQHASILPAAANSLLGHHVDFGESYSLELGGLVATHTHVGGSSSHAGVSGSLFAPLQSCLTTKMRAGLPLVTSKFTPY